MSKLNRQHGAVVIMTAGFMMLAVLFLALVVDTGRLYMEKRNLQRVADVVALELASIGWCADGAPSEDATTALNRNRSSGSGIAFKVTPECGTVSGNPRIFSVAVIPEEGDAVRVEIIHLVAKSIVAGGYFSAEPNVSLSAVAIAARPGNPLARLTIRNEVVGVDSTQSVLLNAVLGNLLDTTLSLSAVSWNDLAQINVNLLDLIGVNGLNLGGYEELLTAEVSLADITLATANVLAQGGNALEVEALGFLQVAVGSLSVNLGDLLGLETGLPESAADVDINVLTLIQGAIQLATTDSVVNAAIPITLPGLGAASVQAKVIEKPRVSAIGDPRDINQGAGWISGHNYDPDEDDGDIFVRTAQVRLLISLQLSGLTGALNTLLGSATLLSPVINLLKLEKGVLGSAVDFLSDTLSAVLGCSGNGVFSCPYRNAVYAETGTLDIGLDVGGANSFVSGHSCGAAKTLNVLGATEIGRIYLGKIQNDTNSGGFFASGSNVNVSPAPLLELGYRRQKYSSCLPLSLVCSSPVWEQESGSPSSSFATARKYVLAGIGVRTGSAGTSLIASPGSLNYDNPPDLDTDPAFKEIVSENLVSGIASTLNNLEIRAYQQNNSSGLLGVLGTVLSAVNGLTSALSQLLSGLAGLLDPILNGVLAALGVNLAKAEVGANMTCHADDTVRLVN